MPLAGVLIVYPVGLFRENSTAHRTSPFQRTLKMRNGTPSDAFIDQTVRSNVKNTLPSDRMATSTGHIGRHQNAQAIFKQVSVKRLSRMFFL
jgi:hypothetical protein